MPHHALLDIEDRQALRSYKHTSSTPSRPSTKDKEREQQSKPASGVAERLGRLRIEQQRHAVNVALRNAKTGAGAKQHPRAGETEAYILPDRNGVVPLSNDELAARAGERAPPQASGSRRTPAGPAAPISWRRGGPAVTPFSTAQPSSGTHPEVELRRSLLGKRARQRSLWIEHCAARYVPKSLLPIPIAEAEDRNLRIPGEPDSETATARGSRGAPTLIKHCLDIVAAHLPPLLSTAGSPGSAGDEATAAHAWLEDQLADMRPEWRIAMMLEGVPRGAGLEVVRMLAAPRRTDIDEDSDEDGPADHQGDGVDDPVEETSSDDWDAASTASFAPSTSLPLLDLAFTPLSLTSLRRFLAPNTPLSASLRSLNLSDTRLSLQDAVLGLDSTVLVRLRHLSLGGLSFEWRGNEESDSVKRSCKHLQRWGVNLEYLDLSYLHCTNITRGHAMLPYFLFRLGKIAAPRDWGMRDVVLPSTSSSSAYGPGLGLASSHPDAAAPIPSHKRQAGDSIFPALRTLVLLCEDRCCTDAQGCYRHGLEDDVRAWRGASGLSWVDMVWE